MRQEGKQIVIGFIADQVPFWNNIHYWTDFLHHDTPVLTGTEKIAIKANFAVYYLDMQRVKRGYYKGEFKLLTDKPKECKKFEITEMYFRELEKLSSASLLIGSGHTTAGNVHVNNGSKL